MPRREDNVTGAVLDKRSDITSDHLENKLAHLVHPKSYPSSKRTNSTKK